MKFCIKTLFACSFVFLTGCFSVQEIDKIDTDGHLSSTLKMDASKVVSLLDSARILQLNERKRLMKDLNGDNSISYGEKEDLRATFQELFDAQDQAFEDAQISCEKLEDSLRKDVEWVLQDYACEEVSKGVFNLELSGKIVADHFSYSNGKFVIKNLLKIDEEMSASYSIPEEDKEALAEFIKFADIEISQTLEFPFPVTRSSAGNVQGNKVYLNLQDFLLSDSKDLVVYTNEDGSITNDSNFTTQTQNTVSKYSKYHRNVINKSSAKNITSIVKPAGQVVRRGRLRRTRSSYSGQRLNQSIADPATKTYYSPNYGASRTYSSRRRY